MTAKSNIRGHEIEEVNGQWVFSDTKEPTITTWKSRNCKSCSKDFGDNDHDPCIENLPDVVNACCGHGEDTEAYAQFPDGRRISGNEATDFFLKYGRSKQVKPDNTEQKISHMSEIKTKTNKETVSLEEAFSITVILLRDSQVEVENLMQESEKLKDSVRAIGIKNKTLENEKSVSHKTLEIYAENIEARKILKEINDDLEVMGYEYSSVGKGSDLHNRIKNVLTSSTEKDGK